MARNKLNDKIREDIVGKIFKTKRYGDFKVLEYVNYNEVLVKFLRTGTELLASKQKVLSGEIKDNFYPRVYGVGYYGDAPTKKGDPYLERVYNIWRKILGRCYFAEECKTPTYNDCTVSEYFKCFANFLNWYTSQIGHDKPDWQLDKDILQKGNRVYSEDTCCIVPIRINQTFKTRPSKVDTCRGVHYDKTLRKYTSHLLGRRLGIFATEIEAFYSYKTAKESHIKQLANEWKDQIDPRVYEALMAWEISFDDK